MKCLYFVSLLFLLSLTGYSQDVQTNGAICGNPQETRNKPSFNWGSGALPFTLPAKLKWQTNYRSAYFFAVILASRRAVKDEHVDSSNCERGKFSERERLDAQAKFPQSKVFTTENGCYMPTQWFTNTNTDYEFIAVYAGTTQASANAIVKAAKANGYSDANIRRMQAVLGYGD